MQKKISSALISVFYKDGLEPVIKELDRLGVTIYSTGGTQQFIESLGVKCIPVETLTTYPSILGGRVKTLHPAIFGGILGRRYEEQDIIEMKEYQIPEIDLVIVDLYPFEKTLEDQQQKALSDGITLIQMDQSPIIEKIDIGGPSMIRAAAKNFKDVVVIAAKEDYTQLTALLKSEEGVTTLDQRKAFAAKAFSVVMHYDIAINNYFSPDNLLQSFEKKIHHPLRYGENPHQKARFYGELTDLFTQLNGKELSYNNLVDTDAAIQLIADLSIEEGGETSFAIVKHTNVCGVAVRSTVKQAWDAAWAGDPESAFGGVLVTNATIDKITAQAISELFFDVLVAPSYDEDALQILLSKKSRTILQLKSTVAKPKRQYKSLLNGTLIQDNDEGNYIDWKEVGGRETTQNEKSDLAFANLVCKHLKSNAIVLVKNKQLVGKGSGQTSRIDALRQSIEKAKQFKFDLKSAVLASDAFFPFNDCVQMAYKEGIEAFIQPGGSVRDKDSIEYCEKNKLAMILTGMRHFRH